jgi:hypothetical protein
MISAIELGRPCRWFSTSRESLRAKPIAANRSIEQEDFEPERGELNPVVTLLEILIILVGILAGFVLLKNRKK